MPLLEKLSEESTWRRFYTYKTSLVCHKPFEQELRRFIDEQAYLPVCERIAGREPFPLPQRSVVNKTNSPKKRVVYVYPRAENIVLKLLTYLLLRQYDSLFCDNLYSFRPGRTAKDAVRRFAGCRELREMYAYKVDISNYFNSVPLSLLLPQLKEVLRDDPGLYQFLSSLLQEERVIDRGSVITEEKGIMAGTPLASFYANLFLRELDRHFDERKIPYARYSDDIIVFAPDAETLKSYADTIRGTLHRHQLRVNPEKEVFYTPREGWTFLGFSYREGTIDIAPVTVQKIKAKMRRKARALQRWRKRNDMTGENAAAAFIRIFNRKLLEGPHDNELTWSSWFFPVINTTASLQKIDRYAQDCIRYLVSGVHRKSRYQVRYGMMKQLGYQNLVHQYYAYRQQDAARHLADAPDAPDG